MRGVLTGLCLLILTNGLRAQHVAAPDTVGGYYVAETIPTPEGLIAETGGIGFLPDGRFIASFHRGEVLTYSLKTKTWTKFAEGLHDPLGLLVVSNREVLVMQRPELTRLRDTDGDGVADEYTTVTDDFGLSGNYHEFAFGPVRDKAGNLYIALNLASNGAGIRSELRGEFNPLGRPGRMYATVPYRGWIMKLTPAGKLVPYASGFRSPNTLGFDAQGRLFVGDNQGDWLGTSKLYHVEEGKWYGHPSSLVWKKDFPAIDPLTLPVARLDSMRTVESIAFPHGLMANSVTQPVFDPTGGKFGPFAGQLFIGEMDHPYLIRVLPETVDGAVQGACVPFYVKGLDRGNNRLAFAPDGSLWVGQNDHGWAGDRGIQRIRYTGGTAPGEVPLEIRTMHLTRDGFDLTFTRPLDPALARDVANYRVQRYYYEYHREYGSKQFDKQPVVVESARLSADGKTVSLKLAELKPGYVFQLNLGELKTPDGTRVRSRLICYTLNRLQPGTPVSQQSSTSKPVHSR